MVAALPCISSASINMADASGAPRRVSMAYILGFSNKPFKDGGPPAPPPAPRHTSTFKQMVTTPGGVIEWAASDGRRGRLTGPGKPRLTAASLAQVPEGKGSSVKAADEDDGGIFGGGGLFDDPPAAKPASPKAADDDEPANGDWTKDQDEKLMELKGENKPWADIASEVDKKEYECKERFKQIKPKDWKPSNAKGGGGGKQGKQKNQKGRKQQDDNKKDGGNSNGWDTNAGGGGGGNDNSWNNDSSGNNGGNDNNSGGGGGGGGGWDLGGDTKDGDNKDSGGFSNDNNIGWGTGGDGGGGWDTSADNKDSDGFKDDSGGFNNDATTGWDTGGGDTGNSGPGGWDTNNNGGGNDGWGVPANDATKDSNSKKTSSAKDSSSDKANKGSSNKAASQSGSKHRSSRGSEKASLSAPKEYELKPDSTFSADDLRLVAKILQQDYSMVWNRVSWRFKDKTGRNLHPDVFEKKITGKIEDRGSERGGR